MRISPEGLKFIRDQEGFSLTVYLDLAGNPTVGTGHLLTPEEIIKWPVGTTITNEEAIDLEEEDVADAEDAVNQLVLVPLSQSQFDAIVDFTFNEGGESLERSTFLEDLNQGHYQLAAAQLPEWDYAGGRPSSDLFKRRMAEQKMFLQESA